MKDKMVALKEIFNEIEALVLGNNIMVNLALAHAKVVKEKLKNLQVKIEIRSHHLAS